MCHREILQRMMCKWGFENSAVKQNKFTVHERAFWNVKEKKPSNLKLHLYVIVLLLFFVTWHFCPDLQRIFVYADKWWATACSREKLLKHVQSGIETVKMWIIFIPTFSKQRGFKPFSYEFLSFILLFFFSQPLKCRQKSSNMATVHSRSLR